MSHKSSFCGVRYLVLALAMVAAALGSFGCSPGAASQSRGVSQSRQALLTPVYQVDCGAGAVSPFTADQFFSGGSGFSTSNAVATTGVANAAPAAVYQSERYGNVSYTFPSLTVGGTYTVRLHFAEIYFSAANSRLFNASVNGTQVLTSLDIFVAAGGANKALVRDFPATANPSGKIVVSFVGVKDNAKVSGIEILSGSAVLSQPPSVATPAIATSPVTAASVAASVLGADDGGEPALTYTWSATGATFAPNATNAAKNTVATFSGAGSYVLTATIRDADGLTATSTVSVVVTQTLSALTVSPLTATVAPLAMKQFGAAATDQFGAAMSSQPSIAWAVTGGGAISASGLFTAGSSTGGPFTVTATGGGVSGTASVTVSAAPPIAYHIDCGGSAVTPFTADQFFSGGSGFSTSNAVATAGVANAAPAAVYQSERYGNSVYTFPGLLAGGAYAVRLHFAEIYFNAANSRLLNAFINGAQVLTSFDIFAAAGGQNKAVALDFPATATAGGQIAVSFVGVKDNAKVSGIEVFATGGPINQAPTVATAASASPNPTTGTTSVLSALGADDGGEPALTYTWATTGTPPGTANFSVNGSNAAKNTTATFSQPGSYSLVVTIQDSGGLSVTSAVTVTLSQPSGVGACDALAGSGTWQNITPPQVLAGFDGTTLTGVFAFAIDPTNNGTIYLGTMSQKLWKSPDCGATWSSVSGRSSAQINVGVNWTMVVDPVDTGTVYTNSGYQGNSNGAYKSTNGGVDWDPIWPPPTQPELANVVQYNFANVFAMDPSNHLHLLLTFHAVCAAPYNQNCIGETTDGGATWHLVNGDPSWDGTEGQVVYFLDNSSTWLWGSSSNNFWRTTNAGATWAQITPVIKDAHPQGSQIIRAADGTFYLAASDGVFRSPDGASWSLIAGTGPLAGGLASDGTTLYLSNNYYFSYGSNLHPYFTAPAAAGAPWTPLTSPGLSSGGQLAYDGAHHLLYSANFQAGFYRVVVP